MEASIDATGVLAAYRESFQRLAALEGFSQQQILKAEAGVILKTWAGRTRVTTEDKAERRMRSSIAWRLGMQNMSGSPYGITINDGSRGGERGFVWFRTRGSSRLTKKGRVAGRPYQLAGKVMPGGYFSASNLHYRNADWEGILEGVTVYTQEMLKRRPLVQGSRDLSRQSVIQIADGLGINLAEVRGGGTLSAAGIAKARAAIASNGSQYRNGTGTEGGNEVSCYIDLINTLPFASKIGMDTTLIQIVANRTKYVETSYKKGAFDSIKKTARAFPNLFTTSGLDVSELSEN